MSLRAAITEKLRQILTLGESPHRTAMAFALGVFIAFSPSYGLHTASVFFVSWAFRLNFLALMAGNLVNNPWTFLPIVSSSLWVGLALNPVGPFPHIDWHGITLTILWEQFRPYLAPFVLGHLLLGLIAAATGYGLLYLAIRKLRERHATTPPRTPVAPPPSSC